MGNYDKNHGEMKERGKSAEREDNSKLPFNIGPLW